MAKKTQAEKTAQNDETAKNNDDPMNDDEEPNFSDPEGFVDDITDEGEYLLASTFPLPNLVPGCEHVALCPKSRHK